MLIALNVIVKRNGVELIAICVLLQIMPFKMDPVLKRLYLMTVTFYIVYQTVPPRLEMFVSIWMEQAILWSILLISLEMSKLSNILLPHPYPHRVL
jgi:hypothetical protein